jgi:uncharacterized protein YjbI with pentapeptide repeats
MTIVKPLRLGLLARAHRQPPKVYYFVAAVGYFDLLEPTDFDLETKMWPKIMPVLGDVSLDLCMPKPAGEVLVAGAACSPRGAPVTQSVVDIRVGPVSKRLAVFGERQWTLTNDGPVFSRPQPFERLPLSWANAFGGAGHATNPGGKGVGAMAALRDRQPAPLPNIEDPDALVLSVDDAPTPVGVLPIPLDGPERMKLGGTADETYLREHFPGHPLDFDWAYYHSAGPDLRAAGFFTGDEAIRIANMHPDHPVIASRLPALRPRAFLNLSTGGGAAEFREVSLRCETVWLFPNQLKGVVLYRGGCEITDIDGLDVKDTLLAYERMADAPRSVDHYLRALQERTDPETAALKFFDEKPLRPDLTEADIAERAQEVADAEAEEERKREKRAEIALLGAFKAAGLPPPPKAAIPKPGPLPVKVPVVTSKQIQRMDVDMAGIMAAGRELQAFGNRLIESSKAQALQETSRWLTKVQSQTKGLLPSAGAAKLAGAAKSVAGQMAKMSIPAGPIPDLGGAGAVNAAAEDDPGGDEILAALAEGVRPEKMAETEEAIAAADVIPDGDIDTEKALARARALGLPEGNLLAPARAEIDALTLDDLAATISDPPGGRAGGSETPDLSALMRTPPSPGPGDTPEIGIDDPDAFLAAIMAPSGDAGPPSGQEAMDQSAEALKTVAKDVPLAAHMMAVAQTAQGPEDPATALEESKAALAEADERAQAGIGEARLISPEPIFPLNPMHPEVSAYLGQVVRDLMAKGESLAGRDLAGAQLAGVDFSGLDMAGVKLERADLRDAKFTACNLEKAVFCGAQMEAADLTGATLSGANLAAAVAPKARFVNAVLSDARLMLSDFTGADFSKATLSASQVLNATLTGATFAGASMERLIFIQSAMTGIVLDQARIEQTMFIQMDMTGLSARGVSMDRCVMVEVTAPEADFTGATLFTTALIGGADLRRARFRDATLTKTGWRQAKLVGADFFAARLDESDLGEADLTAAILSRASFRRANLSAAVLERADLSAANLFEAQARRVNLTHASLRRANLFSANLDEADLSFCDLTGANLNKTIFARPGRVA